MFKVRLAHSNSLKYCKCFKVIFYKMFCFWYCHDQHHVLIFLFLFQVLQSVTVIVILYYKHIFDYPAWMQWWRCDNLRWLFLPLIATSQRLQQFLSLLKDAFMKSLAALLNPDIKEDFGDTLLQEVSFS